MAQLSYARKSHFCAPALAEKPQTFLCTHDGIPNRTAGCRLREASYSHSSSKTKHFGPISLAFDPKERCAIRPGEKPNVPRLRGDLHGVNILAVTFDRDDSRPIPFSDYCVSNGRGARCYVAFALPDSPK
jgi:hypothetical protein